ncbi:MAG: hypothetical protein EAZ60_24390 [Oscillatoriales cyanobacterium]|nr:MAG: hypothetical protein EAZ60_24390 [Oscillatoriales cyanobacterium]
MGQSILDFIPILKKNATVFLFPPDLRKMVLDRVTESDRTKPERETRFLRKNCDEKREIFVETGFLRSQVDKSYLFNL